MSLRVSAVRDLASQGAECRKLAIRRRDPGPGLRHSPVCLGQRPAHNHERSAYHHRCPLNARVAMDQHIMALIDQPGNGRSGVLEFVDSRCAVVH